MWKLRHRRSQKLRTKWQMQNLNLVALAAEPGYFTTITPSLVLCSGSQGVVLLRKVKYSSFFLYPTPSPPLHPLLISQTLNTATLFFKYLE